MRTRIFALILSSLLLTALVVTTFLFFTIKKERLELIDSQIRESAHALLNAQIGEDEHIRYREIEKVISDELGPSRLGKIFVIRNSMGEVIFSSSPRNDIRKLLPHSPQWVTLHTERYWMRILNLSLPKIPDRTLQVGVVLDSDFMSLKRFGQKAWFYISISIAALFALAMLITYFILSPMRKLSHHLKNNISDIDQLKTLSPLPESLSQIGKKEGIFRDELSTLIEMIEKQSHRINDSQNLLKVWTTQLAHELKTPLTVVRMDIEEIQKSSKDPLLESLNSEIDRMAHTLSEFLNWAQLEFSHPVLSSQRFLVSEKIQELLKRLSAHKTVDLNVIDDFEISAPPLLFDQLILNLLTNALKYSAKGSRPSIHVNSQQIAIQDEGEGLPNKVIERLGEPFNKLHSDSFLQANNVDHSTGLGLAICISIARLMRWKIDFSKGPHLRVTLNFFSESDLRVR